VVPVLINKWFWYSLIVVVSWLMVSRLPMMSLKFARITTKSLMPFIIIAVIAVISAFLADWLAVPVTFIAYVVLSLLYKQQTT
jgi:CDP-diacylglycerol--serine O-phosphatidyltransferase